MKISVVQPGNERVVLYLKSVVRPTKNKCRSTRLAPNKCSTTPKHGESSRSTAASQPVDEETLRMCVEAAKPPVGLAGMLGAGKRDQSTHCNLPILLPILSNT